MVTEREIDPLTALSFELFVADLEGQISQMDPKL